MMQPVAIMDGHGAEAELVSAEQLAQQHVAAVAHAAIHAQDDALTQLVADER